MSAVAPQDLARALCAISAVPGFNAEAKTVKLFKKQVAGQLSLGTLSNELEVKEGKEEAADQQQWQRQRMGRRK